MLSELFSSKEKGYKFLKFRWFIKAWGNYELLNVMYEIIVR